MPTVLTHISKQYTCRCKDMQLNWKCLLTLFLFSAHHLSHRQQTYWNCSNMLRQMRIYFGNKKCGSCLSDRVWYGTKCWPWLPKYLFAYYAKVTLGFHRELKGRIINIFQKHWFTKRFSNFTQVFCQLCVICAKHNFERGVPTTQAANPQPDKPDDHLQMDFSELTPSECNQYCSVNVDTFSKWVEAFPTSK